MDKSSIVSTLLVITAVATPYSIPHNGLLRDALCKSGIFVQSLWDSVLEYFNHDEFNVYVYGMTIWTVGVYWFIGLLFLFVDLTSWPKWILKYKVQQEVNKPVALKRIFPVLGTVLFNQFCVSFPFSAFGYYYMKLQGNVTPIAVLPTCDKIVIDIAVFIGVQEMAAYYIHRMFHHRTMYKTFHKKHHEWTAPVALTALYNHPIDHLISNILPAVLGPALMQSHIFTNWLWLTWASFRTLSDHSGYQLPGFPSPRMHDFHHLKFNECYGVWGLADFIHGTDKNFRKWLQNESKQKQSTPSEKLQMNENDELVFQNNNDENCIASSKKQ